MSEPTPDEFDPLALFAPDYQTTDGLFPTKSFLARRRDYVFDITPDGHIVGRPYDERPVVRLDRGEPYETPDGPCSSCERCTWNKGHDCGKTDHPHCPSCSHCLHRH